MTTATTTATTTTCSPCRLQTVHKRGGGGGKGVRVRLDPRGLCLLLLVQVLVLVRVLVLVLLLVLLLQPVLRASSRLLTKEERVGGGFRGDSSGVALEGSIYYYFYYLTGSSPAALPNRSPCRLQTAHKRLNTLGQHN